MPSFDRSRRALLTGAGALLASSSFAPPARAAGSVNILFDSWSTQVLLYKKPSSLPPNFTGTFPGSEPGRLRTLFDTIARLGWRAHFTEPPITPFQLAGVNVYVSLTRFLQPAFAYQKTELDALQNWVEAGGNVLLMTNHGASAGNPTDWTVNDNDLAARFGVSLWNYFVGPGSESPVVPDSACLGDPLPVLSMSVRHSRYSLGVERVWAHDSCLIQRTDPLIGDTATVVAFPDDATAYNPANGTIVTPFPPYFGLEVSHGAGKALVLGNSGWVGDEDTCQPAPGLIHQASNLQFVVNCLSVLGGAPPIKLRD
ncbi:MAG TPA: hypothetical protein VK446_12330 [Methylocystis sp.]|nr:hypothetical protein [Methylocystis sp.]